MQILIQFWFLGLTGEWGWMSKELVMIANDVRDKKICLLIHATAGGFACRTGCDAV